MKRSGLVYVGIKGAVVALDRGSGEIAWSTRLKGGDFVNLLVDGDVIFATTYGEIFSLDASTGQLQWQNRLKGYGLGLAALATESAPPIGLTALLAERHRQEQGNAAAVATTT